MKRFSELKLSVLFSITFFVIQFLTSVLIPAFIIVWSIDHGLYEEPTFSTMVISLGVTSIITGTVLAKIIGSKFLRPITDLNEAFKKLATGNFNIHIKEVWFGREIKEMIRSFNIMTNELKNIETFRSDFITNVSHEFKTPISTIEGYATLLQDENLSKEEQNNYIERILYSTQRLSSLSGNILMISKLENQEIVLDKTDYALDEQIRNCILTLEKLWAEKNLTPDIDLAPVSFYGNKHMVSHIWYNLFSNAIKFTPNGGIISVKLEEKEDRVKVTIADTGIGMTEDTLKHIFEKFYCGDKSRYDSGNGLGLTLVKRVVELCGGSIHVSSEKNYGTAFVIELPNRRQED